MSVTYVWGQPDVIKRIEDISPLCGEVKLTFVNNGPVTVQINNGPRIALEEGGDHWKALAELREPCPWACQYCMSHR